jgi:hypothetical protein
MSDIWDARAASAAAVAAERRGGGAEELRARTAGYSPVADEGRTE